MRQEAQLVVLAGQDTTEGIRLHPGALSRMTRVSPDKSIIYSDAKSDKQWFIAAGAPVSMAALSVRIPDIFPNTKDFVPERGLGEGRLGRYILTFGKGTRICLSFHLAYSELYIILAGIFDKFDRYDGTGLQKCPTLELYYYTARKRDIDVNIDLVVPYPARGSQELRLMARE